MINEVISSDEITFSVSEGTTKVPVIKLQASQKKNRKMLKVI